MEKRMEGRKQICEERVFLHVDHLKGLHATPLKMTAYENRLIFIDGPSAKIDLCMHSS